MRVLLDTCVISELRRKKGSPQVREQVEAIQSCDIFLSVITLGELTKGIAMLRAGKNKLELTEWLLALEQCFADRILPMDLDVARIWGELTARAKARGMTVSASDGIIAATALRHGLHVMTRNVRDFRETGALVLDPWDKGQNQHNGR